MLLLAYEEELVDEEVLKCLTEEVLIKVAYSDLTQIIKETKETGNQR